MRGQGPGPGPRVPKKSPLVPTPLPTIPFSSIPESQVTPMDNQATPSCCLFCPAKLSLGIPQVPLWLSCSTLFSSM